MTLPRTAVPRYSQDSRPPLYSATKCSDELLAMVPAAAAAPGHIVLRPIYAEKAPRLWPGPRSRGACAEWGGAGSFLSTLAWAGTLEDATWDSQVLDVQARPQRKLSKLNRETGVRRAVRGAGRQLVACATV